MALLPPIFQQNNQYSARVTRQLVDEIGTEGVVGAGDFAVTERAAGASMSVDIAAGRAFIAGTDQANQGTYLCISESVENVVVQPADPSLARIDLVVAQVRDPNAGGVAGDDWAFVVIEGTPDVAPVAPALPDSAIPLAEVEVGAAVTSILDADITDLRTFSDTPVRADLDDLRDVDASSPNDGDILVYDDIAGEWVSSAAGGLVAVKHVLKTDTFSASVTAGDNVAVTGMSITHEVADAANRLIVTAYFGAAATSSSTGQVGIAVAQDGTLIGVGDAAGSRTQVGAGGNLSATALNTLTAFPSVTFVHTPGAGSKTFTVRAINTRDDTRTLFVNRMESDSDNEFRVRAASALVIQEVAV